MARFVNLKEALVKKLTYGSNKRVAIQLVNGFLEPLMTASVNLPDHHLEEGDVFIKDWSENEGVVEDLIELGIIEPDYKRIPNGFVNVVVGTMTKEFKERKFDNN